MDIFKYDLYGGPNVGIYAQANNEHVFLPRGFAKTKAEHIEKYLGLAKRLMWLACKACPVQVFQWYLLVLNQT